MLKIITRCININIILLQKKQKKKEFCRIGRSDISRSGIRIWDLRATYIYLPNYLTRLNDLGYPSTCVFSSFLLDICSVL